MPSEQIAKCEQAMLNMMGAAIRTDVEPPVLVDMLRALNGTLEELSINAPSDWWGEDEFGEMVNAPQTVTVSVTSGSRALTISGALAWFPGCSIVINDDTTVNRLRKTLTGYELFQPYVGGGGSRQALVYHDSVFMPENTRQFKSGITWVGDSRKIGTVADEHQLTAGDGPNGPEVGEPRLARLTRVDDADQKSRPAVRFDRLPQRAGRIKGWYYRKAYNVPNFDSNISELVPGGYVDSILIPMVKFRFSSHPAVVEDVKALQTQLAAAFAILTTIGETDEQSTSTLQLQPRFW